VKNKNKTPATFPLAASGGHGVVENVTVP